MIPLVKEKQKDVPNQQFYHENNLHEIYEYMQFEVLLFLLQFYYMLQ